MQNAPQKLNVLLVAPLPPPAGGIATWTKALLEFANTQSDINLVCVDTATRWRALTNTQPFVRAIGGIIQAIGDVNRVRKAIKREHPDMLHLCTSGMMRTPKDIAILLIAKRNGVRTITHYRMGKLPSVLSCPSMLQKATLRAMHLSDTVAVLDTASLAAVRAILPESRSGIIPNFINLSYIDGIKTHANSTEPIGDRPLKVLYVGHVIPQKGIRELVDACVALPDVPMQLTLIGPIEQSFREELMAKVGLRAGADWFHLIHESTRDDCIRAMFTNDVVVLPSYTEGFPNVILEAMACGKAIIATRVGAIQMILDENGAEQCGICIDHADMAALKNAIRDLAEQPDMIVELGIKARARVECLYDIQAVFKQLTALWSTPHKQ